jgi:hypothetical protein
VFDVTAETPYNEDLMRPDATAALERRAPRAVAVARIIPALILGLFLLIL